LYKLRKHFAGVEENNNGYGCRGTDESGVGTPVAHDFQAIMLVITS